jgi:hypothetical protein
VKKREGQAGKNTLKERKEKRWTKGGKLKEEKRKRPNLVFTHFHQKKEKQTINKQIGE